VSKLTHAEAGYHRGPGETGSHCGICRHFRRGVVLHCEIVEDPIRSQDGCDKFEQRPGTARL